MVPEAIAGQLGLGHPVQLPVIVTLPATVRFPVVFVAGGVVLSPARPQSARKYPLGVFS